MNANYPRFGPKGLIMNTQFEGGVMLSPLYDVEANKKRLEKEKGITNGSEEANGSEEEDCGNEGERP